MKKYLMSRDGKSFRFVCDYPNQCPICNNSISPGNKMEFVNNDIKMVFILFICPACGKGFVTHYELGNNSLLYNGYSYNEARLTNSYPVIPAQHIFDDCIKNLSPEFCDIYNQAHSAECYGLKDISGMGYRKALEFLIKDYSIYRNQKDKAEIEKMNLSQVIDKYIDGDKLHTLAKASTWIGNDETHYIKKIENKDVNDLKRFISAVVAYITYDLTADEAFNMINI